MSANLFKGPRILYDPTRWNSSAFSRTSNPVTSESCRDVSRGVCLMCCAMRARASRKSSRVRVSIFLLPDLSRGGFVGSLELLELLVDVCARGFDLVGGLCLQVLRRPPQSFALLLEVVERALGVGLRLSFQFSGLFLEALA